MDSQSIALVDLNILCDIFRVFPRCVKHHVKHHEKKYLSLEKDNRIINKLKTPFLDAIFD